VSTLNSLKIIFAGTPVFAAVALQALIDSPHQVIAVYTQPDRPAGRGRQLTSSPVKTLALQHNLPIFQPENLRAMQDQTQLAELHADIMVVAAYGLLLPSPILQAPRLGCINIHASLLPRWRGAAPIQRALLAGDEKTGITIMQMEKGLDTGAMLYEKTCSIHETDTSGLLHDKLAQLGAEALLTVLHQLPQLKPEIQDEALVTYAQKITKQEALLDWHSSAEELSRKIRAFNPWPIAYTYHNKQVIRVWDVMLIDCDASKYHAGEIIKANANGIDIATGKKGLRLLKIQLPNGRVLPVADILNGQSHDFMVGKVLG
jgi:methionyl-tRNA formyltransferase